MKFKSTLNFIFNYLENNKFKMFKWKLLHFILPCNELLVQWKVLENNSCNFCKEIDNYKHFFITCPYNNTYWQEIYKLLLYLKIDRHILRLENLITGYKIADVKYFDINTLITVIFFSIYKAHFVSNKKESKIEIFKIFKKEIYDIIRLHSIRNIETGNMLLKTSAYCNL